MILLYILVKSLFSASIENVRVSDQLKHIEILIPVLCAMKIYLLRDKINHLSDILPRIGVSRALTYVIVF